ncbi:MgtC/SapB family protein [Imhoffiella purpurea]|nr:MgtC/SapB family protein [Imhoffiella purpurea]
MNDEQQIFYRLGVALAIGLLIGTERGWKARRASEGRRVAGVRTYGLIGLLGGVTALLSQTFGPVLLALVFIGLAALATATYVIEHAHDQDLGITSLVAVFLTFAFGALAVAGEVSIAAACAVVATLVLSAKPMLHRWVERLGEAELKAGLELLLISVVVLPILPDRGYGPWQALNPYTIWWMVVLIAGISFAGYISVKLIGARRGIVATGLMGGIASSTAVTLNFSRMARQESDSAPILAMGILLACMTMFPRMLMVTALLHPALARQLLTPVGLMTLCLLLPALLQWRNRTTGDAPLESPLKNPLEFGTALTFGLLLALVMFFGTALHQWFGTAGVLALAAISGITDVDAITLSLARMSNDGIGIQTAATGILIAASANNLTKGLMAATIGGRAIRLRVGLPLAASAAVGLSTAWIWAAAGSIS